MTLASVHPATRDGGQTDPRPPATVPGPAEPLAAFVARQAPRLFALVDDGTDHEDYQILAWGLAYRDHVNVVSPDGNLWGTFSSVDTPMRRTRFWQHPSRSSGAPPAVTSDNLELANGPEHYVQVSGSHTALALTFLNRQQPDPEQAAAAAQQALIVLADAPTRGSLQRTTEIWHDLHTRWPELPAVRDLGDVVDQSRRSLAPAPT